MLEVSASRAATGAYPLRSRGSISTVARASCGAGGRSTALGNGHAAGARSARGAAPCAPAEWLRRAPISPWAGVVACGSGIAQDPRRPAGVRSRSRRGQPAVSRYTRSAAESGADAPRRCTPVRGAARAAPAPRGRFSGGQPADARHRAPLNARPRCCARRAGMGPPHEVERSTPRQGLRAADAAIFLVDRTPTPALRSADPLRAGNRPHRLSAAAWTARQRSACRPPTSICYEHHGPLDMDQRGRARHVSYACLGQREKET